MHILFFYFPKMADLNMYKRLAKILHDTKQEECASTATILHF